MLNSVFDKEEKENYPTVRAMLSEFYGDHFNSAKVYKVKSNSVDVTFRIKLERGEEYLLSINKPSVADLYVDSSLIKSISGHNNPILSSQAKGILLPSNLIGCKLSLKTMYHRHRSSVALPDYHQHTRSQKRAPYYTRRIENEDLSLETDPNERAFQALDLQSSTRESPTMILSSKKVRSPVSNYQKRLLESVNYSLLSADVTTQYRRPLYERLIDETKLHKSYLTQVGLEERAKGINLYRFTLDEKDLGNANMQFFESRTAIPQEVLDFDPNKKNTIITTDPNVAHNKQEDLNKILDIRLYPVLRNMIKSNRLEVFLGTKKEMAAYYRSKGSEILFQFGIPSSATYYLAETSDHSLCVVMANLVSKENIIAQLLTVKLAGINNENIEIIGDSKHFSEIVKNDMTNLLKQIPELKMGNHSLVVAGCGLENMVSEIIERELKGRLDKPNIFKGDIISLIYIPLLHPENDVYGFISLHLNYGEIMEYITTLFLEQCNCKQVFTGSAGGYISHTQDEIRPTIGSRMSIITSVNEKGEVATVSGNVLYSEKDHIFSTHLQIPSIFLETYDWLHEARKRGSSVDVETFYIIRAIQNYNIKNPTTPVKADCGYFVSDYVGEKPLREYSRVFQHYPEALSQFLNASLSNKSKPIT